MERPVVLLVLEDEGRYVEALTAAGFQPIIGIEGAAAHAGSGLGIDLAVIDCDAPIAGVQQAYDLLHDDSLVPSLLLFRDQPPELEPSMERATFDEYLRMPIGASALIYRLQALLIRAGRSLPSESGSWADAESLTQHPVAGEGHAVSIFSPKGGVGTTTLAVNLAVALREQTRSSVLLLDANAGVGNVSSMLEASYGIGLADLAREEWTDESFEQAVTTHQSGVRVLVWGSNPGQSELVTADLLLAAMRWARAHHSFVIVDNNSTYDDRTMAVLTVSSEIFLVLTPEMGALRNGTQFLDLARAVGLGDSIRIIVNRANHGIRVADMAEALRMPIAATILSSGPKAVMAANEGKPIVTKFPKERITQELHRVARLVTQPHAREPQAGGAERRWWPRLGARPSVSGAGR